MTLKTLGQTDLPISSIGYGAMPLSCAPSGAPLPSEAQAIALIHRALDLGVTLIDTADCYCTDDSDFHHNEKLIRLALDCYPGSTEQVIVATKGGVVRPGGDWVPDSNPERLRRTIEESFWALGGRKPIDLWQLHAYDPRYPLEEVFAVIQEAVAQGLIRHVGLSNFHVPQIRQIRQFIEIVSVQNQFNPWCRWPEFLAVISYCRQEGMTFLAWGPLGGQMRSSRLSEIPVLAELAAQLKISVQRLTLAWMRSKSACIVPLAGARRSASLEDSVLSTQVHLSLEQVRLIDQQVPHQRQVAAKA